MIEIENTLANKLVLLIEADSFLAGYIGDSLKQAGAQILGPARTVEEANALIARLREPPDAAVVNAEIFEAAGAIVGDALSRLDVPLLLVAGRPPLPSTLAHTILTTPFAAYQVVDHLRGALADTTEDEPSRPDFGATVRGH